MNKTGGLSVFFEQDVISVEELAEFSYAGFKTIAARGTVGEGAAQNDAAELLKKDGIEVFLAGGFAGGFEDTLRETGITTVTLKEKDMEDLLHTFGEKDTEVYIVDTDEGTRKVKAISGSLSVSYVL